MFLEPGHKYIFNKKNIKTTLSDKFKIIKYSTSRILVRGKIPFLFVRNKRIENYIYNLYIKNYYFRVFYITMFKFLDFFNLGDISYYLLKKK